WPQLGVESARGLLTLAAKPRFVDQALINALNRLANHPAAAVRHEMASNCWLLYRNSPNHVWRWIGHLALDESMLVRHAAIRTLSRLATEHTDRAIPLIISTLHATPRGEGGKRPCHRDLHAGPSLLVRLEGKRSCRCRARCCGCER